VGLARATPNRAGSAQGIERLTAPSGDILDKQVLERLITERALTQIREGTGIPRRTTRPSSATICGSPREQAVRPTTFARCWKRKNIPVRERIARTFAVRW
jgi:hypothetical protein